MFGYITFNKAELKCKEYDLYRAYYCGLCENLKQRYGRLGQLTLSYDMTFLLLLLSSLYEPQGGRSYYQRCVVHPIKKHRVENNIFTSYVADMNMLLAHYKMRDDWQDEGKISRYLLWKISDKKVQKIHHSYPRQTAVVSKQLALMLAIEKGREEERKEVGKLPEYLRMADLFGKILGEVFIWQEDQWQQDLYQVGYHLGRFVYLLDAYEDIERDKKKQCYNPLAAFSKDEKFAKWFQQLLIQVIEQCARAFERLPIVENVQLLRNIIYSGVWTAFPSFEEEK